MQKVQCLYQSYAGGFSFNDSADVCLNVLCMVVGKHNPTVEHALLWALHAQTEANQYTNSCLWWKHAAEIK